MPISSSSASSTEHCTSTPGDPTAAPMDTATALEARRRGPARWSRARGSRTPPRSPRRRRAAAGRRSRLVTCAWLLGVRRARSLVIAIPSSTGRSSREAARQLGRRHAGGQPDQLRARHGRVDEHAGEGEVVERHRLRGDVEVEAVPGDELVDARRSRLGRARVHLDDPPVASTTRDGAGSAGESKAISPSAASSTAKPSRLTRCASMNRNRPIGGSRSVVIQLPGRTLETSPAARARVRSCSAVATADPDPADHAAARPQRHAAGEADEPAAGRRRACRPAGRRARPGPQVVRRDPVGHRRVGLVHRQHRAGDLGAVHPLEATRWPPASTTAADTSASCAAAAARAASTISRASARSTCILTRARATPPARCGRWSRRPHVAGSAARARRRARTGRSPGRSTGSA